MVQQVMQVEVVKVQDQVLQDLVVLQVHQVQVEQQEQVVLVQLQV